MHVTVAKHSRTGDLATVMRMLGSGDQRFERVDGLIDVVARGGHGRGAFLEGEARVDDPCRGVFIGIVPSRAEDPVPVGQCFTKVVAEVTSDGRDVTGERRGSSAAARGWCANWHG